MPEPESPGKLWPLRPMPADWTRGPAWLDGDYLVMDSDRASTYQPLAAPEIGIELARVRTPDEAIDFVGRFGLLRTRAWRRLKGRPPLRERFSDFAGDAEDLREILETVMVVRRGCEGDADAIGQLHDLLFIPEDLDVTVVDPDTGDQVRRRAGDAYTPHERFVDADDRTILMHASELVARRINEGLADSPACVFDRAFLGESVPPGAWRIGIVPNTLAGVCYLSAALAVADRERIAVCQEETCRRIFFVTDGRQRFCTTACGSRARYRRFQDRQRHSTTSQEGQ